jgi:heme-degrading monooxygenase HmoA
MKPVASRIEDTRAQIQALHELLGSAEGLISSWCLESTDTPEEMIRLMVWQDQQAANKAEQNPQAMATSSRLAGMELTEQLESTRGGSYHAWGDRRSAGQRFHAELTFVQVNPDRLSDAVSRAQEVNNILKRQSGYVDGWVLESRMRAGEVALVAIWRTSADAQAAESNNEVMTARRGFLELAGGEMTVTSPGGSYEAHGDANPEAAVYAPSVLR